MAMATCKIAIVYFTKDIFTLKHAVHQHTFHKYALQFDFALSLSLSLSLIFLSIMKNTNETSKRSHGDRINKKKSLAK